MSKLKLSNVGAVVSLFALGAALVLGLAIVGSASASTPLVATLIGTIVTAIPALIGASKADQVHRDMGNGVLKGNVKAAVEELVKSGALQLPLANAIETVANNYSSPLSIAGSSDEEAEIHMSGTGGGDFTNTTEGGGIHG